MNPAERRRAARRQREREANDQRARADGWMVHRGLQGACSDCNGTADIVASPGEFAISDITTSPAARPRLASLHTGQPMPDHNNPDKENHVQHEITTVTRPAETILVNPREMAFTYDSVNGQDVISILLDDKRVGALMVTLTPQAAQHVAAHLAAMVDDIGGLRAEWQRRQGSAR